jgi:hypothetical protein
MGHSQFRTDGDIYRGAAARIPQSHGKLGRIRRPAARQPNKSRVMPFQPRPQPTRHKPPTRNRGCYPDGNSDKD